MTTAEIVLASTSSSRRQMLQSSGVEFRVVASEVDEEPLRIRLTERGAAPNRMAAALAEAKALAVSRTQTGALVIGADQILVCGGRLFNKAENEVGARAVLQALRGLSHELISSACIAQDGIVLWRDTQEAKMAMRDFSAAFLETYLRAELPHVLACVGCYRIEGLGAQLFSETSGDQFCIRGLPLFSVLNALRRYGGLAS